MQDCAEETKISQEGLEFHTELLALVDKYIDRLTVAEALFSLQSISYTLAVDASPSSEEAIDALHQMVDCLKSS